MAEDASSDLSTLTADIVAAYVSNNKISGEELTHLIGSTYLALKSAGEPTPAVTETLKPDKAAIRKSIHPDYLTSFIDGRRYKSLKRHLNSQGLSPGEYRERFSLPSDYPMVSPNYSAQRSALAKSLGLGRKAGGAAPTPEPEAAAPPAKGRGRGRAKKAEPASA